MKHREFGQKITYSGWPYAKGVHDLTKKARRHSGNGSVFNNGDSGFVGAEALPDGVWARAYTRPLFSTT
jgi:hypothetical protein